MYKLTEKNHIFKNTKWRYFLKGMHSVHLLIHKEYANIKKKKIKGKQLYSSTPEMSICAPSLNKAMCSKQERMEPRLKCQPSNILIGAEALQSREQNSASTEVSGNEPRFVCGGSLADWNYTAVSDQTVNIVI